MNTTHSGGFEPVRAVGSLLSGLTIPWWITGGGAIEDRLHWATSPTTRTALRSAPATALASWPACLTTTILRLTGETSIAAALRYSARRPSRPRQTIMNC
jgi:hypothetical protein